MPKKLERKQVVCACGCGEPLWSRDSRGRSRRFISGHNTSIRELKARVIIECAWCGNMVEKLPCQIRSERVFCSLHCKSKWIGQQLSSDQGYKDRQSDITRENGNRPPIHMGANHWNWRGGISKNNSRNTQSYKRWRKAVLRAANYTCVACGTRGGRLSAHHIIPWSECEALRYNVDNGACMCYDCRMELHGLGKKDASKE